MTDITIIVAIDAQRGIGVNNTLPWHLPEDLAHFKRLTSGHPIVMGRKTFDSIGRALPNRRNIVVTRNADWRHDGVDAVDSLPAALALAGDVPSLFIIGGAQIFEQALPLAQRLVITEIQSSFACDTFFPMLDDAQWEESERSVHEAASGLRYAIVNWQRKAPSTPN
ncbi:dihydrofolate reductase [Oxalobacteraceae bacterium]|nr:dihydrofolate reductase [Oxalobacteraceae bacterium]